jgi:hypothetical protein
MKNYEEKEAMDEIFNSKVLTSAERMNKNRYAKGTLSKKAIDKILIENNFQILQEKLYIKKNDSKG